LEEEKPEKKRQALWSDYAGEGKKTRAGPFAAKGGEEGKVQSLIICSSRTKTLKKGGKKGGDADIILNS